MIDFKFICLSITASLFLLGCGVRGRPQPPIEPPDLGRGKPTFTRANRELAIPEVPSPEASPTPLENPAEGY